MLKVLPRVFSSKEIKWSYLKSSFLLSSFGLMLVGFFLSRAVIMGELYPFGIGFLAGVCLTRAWVSKAVLAGVVIGTLLTVDSSNLVGYLVSMGLVYIILSRYNRRENYWLVVPSLVAAIHLLVRGSEAVLSNNGLYEWLGVIFESFFAGVLTLVTITGLNAYPKLLEGKTIPAEEKTSLGLVALGVLIGIKQDAIWGIGLQSVLSRLLVLWGSFLGGPGGGAAVGVAVGLVPSLQGTLNSGPIALYALAGLLGGVFNSFRKAGVSIGFTLGLLLLSLFYSEQATLVHSLRETGIAILLFFLFKPSIFEKIIGEEEKLKEIREEDSRTVMVDKLRKMSHFFYELGQCFLQQEREDSGPDQLNALFNKVSAQVCEGCSLRRICWEQDFYKTYRSLLEVCTKMEQKGAVSEKDFSTNLKRRCMRLRELGVALNSQLELLNIINFYDKQFRNCRELLSFQLQGLGRIVEYFSEELKNDYKYDQQLEEKLFYSLQEKGIQVKEIMVTEVTDGEKEITIVQSTCRDQNWCKTMVAPNISQVLDKPYVLKGQECNYRKKEGLCSFYLVPSRPLVVKVGKAQCRKDGTIASGDVCSSLVLPEHRYALVMSDGMGTGREAQLQSEMAVNLLEKLLLAGFSSSLAVRIVNSAMVMRMPQERFVALDLVVINQVNGQTDFIKIGGAPSFICTAKGVSAIKSVSPPAGILESIEPHVSRQVLAPDNVIIMMSDGLWEAIQGPEGVDKWIRDTLQKIKGRDPQQIANQILYRAKSIKGNYAQDDMCVQVALIERREIA